MAAEAALDQARDFLGRRPDLVSLARGVDESEGRPRDFSGKRRGAEEAVEGPRERGTRAPRRSLLGLMRQEFLLEEGVGEAEGGVRPPIGEEERRRVTRDDGLEEVELQPRQIVKAVVEDLLETPQEGRALGAARGQARQAGGREHAQLLLPLFVGLAEAQEGGEPLPLVRLPQKLPAEVLLDLRRRDAGVDQVLEAGPQGAGKRAGPRGAAEEDREGSIFLQQGVDEKIVEDGVRDQLRARKPRLSGDREREALERMEVNVQERHGVFDRGQALEPVGQAPRRGHDGHGAGGTFTQESLESRHEGGLKLGLERPVAHAEHGFIKANWPGARQPMRLARPIAARN